MIGADFSMVEIHRHNRWSEERPFYTKKQKTFCAKKYVEFFLYKRGIGEIPYDRCWACPTCCAITGFTYIALKLALNIAYLQNTFVFFIINDIFNWF